MAWWIFHKIILQKPKLIRIDKASLINNNYLFNGDTEL